jgi:hypothetical protein
MGKYQALDASAKKRVMQLYAEAGFPSDQSKFGVANFFVTTWAKVSLSVLILICHAASSQFDRRASCRA